MIMMVGMMEVMKLMRLLSLRCITPRRVLAMLRRSHET
jgi:hypothetical protein